MLILRLKLSILFPSETDSPYAHMTPAERFAMREKEKMEKIAERLAKQEELRKKLEEDKQKRKEEREKEREKKKEEKRKEMERLKEWSKPREDMECDDLKVCTEFSV